ncbi:MAG: NUDIX domain-containing protein [Clostridia bacterium]|nr:NUDIX domain-containing protein [Clostridia bacterium]
MEYLDILDEKGNKTGKKDTRENIHKLGLLHSEVAAFIYTDTGKVILQKRKSNKATYAGVWSVTGGHVLAGENNEEAILREIKEELNLNIEKEKVIFVTTYKSKKVKDDVINNKFFSIYNVEISENQFETIKIQKEELEDIKLFSIEEIESIMNSGDKQYKFPQNSEMAIKLIKKEGW